MSDAERRECPMHPGAIRCVHYGERWAVEMPSDLPFGCIDIYPRPVGEDDHRIREQLSVWIQEGRGKPWPLAEAWVREGA